MMEMTMEKFMWWRWCGAFYGIWTAFLPASPDDSAWSFGLTDHPVGLAAINATLILASVALVVQGRDQAASARDSKEGET